MLRTMPRWAAEGALARGVAAGVDAAGAGTAGGGVCGSFIALGSLVSLISESLSSSHSDAPTRPERCGRERFAFSGGAPAWLRALLRAVRQGRYVVEPGEASVARRLAQLFLDGHEPVILGDAL